MFDVDPHDARRCTDNAYRMALLGLLLVIPWVYLWFSLKKNNYRVKSTYCEDHYLQLQQMIKQGIICSAIGLALSFSPGGWLVLLIVWPWSLCRILYGQSRLNQNLSYYRGNVVVRSKGNTLFP